MSYMDFRISKTVKIPIWNWMNVHDSN